MESNGPVLASAIQIYRLNCYICFVLLFSLREIGYCYNEFVPYMFETQKEQL